MSLMFSWFFFNFIYFYAPTTLFLLLQFLSDVEFKNLTVLTTSKVTLDPWVVVAPASLPTVPLIMMEYAEKEISATASRDRVRRECSLCNKLWWLLCFSGVLMTWLFQIEIYFPVTSKFRLTFNKNAESLALQAAQLSSLHHTYRFTHTPPVCFLWNRCAVPGNRCIALDEKIFMVRLPMMIQSRVPLPPRH